MTYGSIIEGALEETYDKLKVKIFDITQTLLNLYRVAKELCEVTVTPTLLYTDQQQLDFGVKLIKKTHALEAAQAVRIKN